VPLRRRRALGAWWQYRFGQVGLVPHMLDDGARLVAGQHLDNHAQERPEKLAIAEPLGLELGQPEGSINLVL